MSIFHEIQMATYFGTGWCYSHTVEYAGSPTYTAYVGMTLTRSKVKVMGLLNFRQLAKPCMLAAMTAAPLRGFLVWWMGKSALRELLGMGDCDSNKSGILMGPQREQNIWKWHYHRQRGVCLKKCKFLLHLHTGSSNRSHIHRLLVEVIKSHWWAVSVTTPSYACRSPIFEFPSRKAITRVQTLSSVDTWQNSNGHISVVHDATVTRFGMGVVLHVLCMLTWPWLDPRSRSRSIWTSASCS